MLPIINVTLFLAEAASYFSAQVDIIMNSNGIVDKYTGDAIMAFWGAPLNRKDDAFQSVLSALDMIDALKDFNNDQLKLGKLQDLQGQPSPADWNGVEVIKSK